MALSSPDLLYHVSAYLNHRDLTNFSLVNRQCHDFARKHLFRTIALKFSSPDTLNPAVKDWNCILQRTQSFQHVRHVKVLARYLFRQPSTPTMADCGDDPAEPWNYCFVEIFKSTLVNQDSEWEDLGYLIQKLPKLQDLTWGCQEQIPTSILRYINHKRPNLRLHMRNFEMSSLIRRAAKPIVLDLYEIELATSPYFYSLTRRYGYLEANRADYHVDAIMDLLAGAAPNLRELNFWLSRDHSPQPLPGPRHQYQRGSIPCASSSGFGPLKPLNIVADDSTRALRQWSSVTDFANLQSLTVHYHVKDDTLLWLASCRLLALERLSLNVGDKNSDPTEALNMLILSLPCLDSLKLAGHLTLWNLIPTLEHCGQQLRRLLLSHPEPRPDMANIASKDFILTLQKKCPQLEELALCIMRSQGDAEEVAVYRALGAFRHVGKIHLTVYCPPPFPASFQSSDEFENYYASDQVPDKETKAAMDNALMNAAIDENLARSIYRTVSTSRAEFSYPLERLSLRVGKTYKTTQFTWKLAYIGRSWTCIRNDRDDRLHECSSASTISEKNWTENARKTKIPSSKSTIRLSWRLSVVFGLPLETWIGREHGMAFHLLILDEA